LKFCVLASSSSGNCSVVQANGTTVLVDAGISARRITRGLEALGLGAKIDAIFVSHEHTDHCNALGVVAKRFGCPIYANERTLAEISPFLKGGEKLVATKRGHSFSFQDLEVSAFHVSHDASDPCGYTFFDGQHRVGVCTDLGALTDEVQTHLSRCHAVCFEANHDPELLQNGRYPEHLKSRIRGAQGHISNAEAGQGLAMMALQGSLKHAILAHLSEHNNRPDLALKTVKRCLKMYDLELDVSLAHKTSPSKLIAL